MDKAFYTMSNKDKISKILSHIPVTLTYTSLDARLAIYVVSDSEEFFNKVQRFIAQSPIKDISSVLFVRFLEYPFKENAYKIRGPSAIMSVIDVECAKDFVTSQGTRFDSEYRRTLKVALATSARALLIDEENLIITISSGELDA